MDVVAGDKIKEYIDNVADNVQEDKVYEFRCPKCGRTWTKKYNMYQDIANEVMKNYNFHNQDAGYNNAYDAYDIPDNYDDDDDDSGNDIIKCLGYFNDYLKNPFMPNTPFKRLKQFRHEMNHLIGYEITDPIAQSGIYLLKALASFDCSASGIGDRKQVIKFGLDDIQKALNLYDSDENRVYQAMFKLLELNLNDDMDLSHYERIKNTCPDILSIEYSFLDVEYTQTRFNNVYEFVTIAIDVSKEAGEEIEREEQEYLNEVRACLESGGTISASERRLLEKLRNKLEITEERAAELEASLSAPKLTKEEKEYLEEVHACLEDGEKISAGVRRLLDKLRLTLGISEKRAAELELYVIIMRMYQNGNVVLGRDIFLYLSARNMLIFKDCLTDKYKNMSLQCASLAF